jgi:hypothetical protein
MASKFPSTIYVTRENVGTEDEYLNISADLPDAEETTPVAVYKLAEVGQVTVTRQYEKKLARRR